MLVPATSGGRGATWHFGVPFQYNTRNGRGRQEQSLQGYSAEWREQHVPWITVAVREGAEAAVVDESAGRQPGETECAYQLFYRGRFTNVFSSPIEIQSQDRRSTKAKAHGFPWGRGIGKHCESLFYIPPVDVANGL